MKPDKKETMESKFGEEKQLQNKPEKKVKKIFTLTSPKRKKDLLKSALTRKTSEKSPGVKKKKVVLKKTLTDKVRELPPPEKKVVLKKTLTEKVRELSLPGEKKVVLKKKSITLPDKKVVLKKKGSFTSKTREKSPIVKKVLLKKTLTGKVFELSPPEKKKVVLESRMVSKEEPSAPWIKL